MNGKHGVAPSPLSTLCEGDTEAIVQLRPVDVTDGTIHVNANIPNVSAEETLLPVFIATLALLEGGPCPGCGDVGLPRLLELALSSGCIDLPDEEAALA